MEGLMGQRSSGLGLLAGGFGSGLGAAALIGLLGLIGLAIGGPTKAKGEEMTIGLGRVLVCSTQGQAGLFARLMADGATPLNAMKGVGLLYRTEDACRVREISWRKLSEVSSIAVPNGRISVVSIVIITEMSQTPTVPQMGYLVQLSVETRA
jgi:hypothetical protein